MTRLIEELVEQASVLDKPYVRKALEGAWSDQRCATQKSCLLSSSDGRFYDVTMTLQTKGTKSRWRVELKITQAL